MTIEKLQEAQRNYAFIQEAQETLEHISAMKEKRKVVISGLSDNSHNIVLGYPKPIKITNEELVDLIFRKVVEDIEANLAFCEAQFNEL